MKIHRLILALFLAQEASAFMPVTSPAQQRTPSSALNVLTQGLKSDLPPFPMNEPFKRLQGGGTVMTWPMPVDAERVEMCFRSSGRPMKVTVQLWVGPIRQTHNMSIDMENGAITPFRSVLKFKKGVGPVLRVITTDSVEFPMEAAISVPSKERSEMIGDITERLFDSSEKLLIQGGDITSAKGAGFGKSGGTGGAVRTFPIPTEVNAIQMICWSRDTGTKSLKARVELLQGPNNVKQNFDLQVSGSHQPYTCVFRTPGPGYQIRIQNKKFVEDGLFQVALIPIDG